MGTPAGSGLPTLTAANGSATAADVISESNSVFSNTSSGMASVTSDCAKRLNHWSTRSSACIVIRGNQVLLVHVPYGESPGWDFPGGQAKGCEPACETAEREVCEETGYRVKATRKLTYDVFLCDYVASHVCTKSVDEGFLRKQWYHRSEIDSLTYRGGTWGDKRGLIHRYLH